MAKQHTNVEKSETSISPESTEDVENPYAPGSIALVTTTNKRLGPISSLVFSLVGPPVIASVLYIPFRLLASQINTVTVMGPEDFYYTGGVATWPTYMACLALITCSLARRLKVRVFWDLILAFMAYLSVWFTQKIDELSGWNDTGREGLDFYSVSYLEGMSTPELSMRLVGPAFLASWILTLAVWKVNRWRSIKS